MKTPRSCNFGASYGTLLALLLTAFVNFLGAADPSEAVTNLQGSVKGLSMASIANIQLLKFAFADLSVSAHGGDGTMSSSAKGAVLATKSFIWETFSVNLSKDTTLATMAYSLSIPGRSVLGVFIDGKPMTYIQNMPNNELQTEEMFPLAKTVNAGKHQLTVSFESLDKVPMAATLKGIGFYNTGAPR